MITLTGEIFSVHSIEYDETGRDRVPPGYWTELKR